VIRLAQEYLASLCQKDKLPLPTLEFLDIEKEMDAEWDFHAAMSVTEPYMMRINSNIFKLFKEAQEGPKDSYHFFGLRGEIDIPAEKGAELTLKILIAHEYHHYRMTKRGRFFTTGELRADLFARKELNLSLQEFRLLTEYFNDFLEDVHEGLR